MKIQLLKDPDLYPSTEVLREIFKDNLFNIFEWFTKTITDEEYNLSLEWRFYKDGKAWLGKVVRKKKTILWLSAWEGFFKVGFFFTEKHREGITKLNISETVKQKFNEHKPIGRLIAMTFDVKQQEQLEEILTIVQYKKTLK